MMESWRSAFQPHISCTAVVGRRRMETAPRGYVTLDGVDVTTEGREDSKKRYGVVLEVVENVNRRWPTREAVGVNVENP